MKIDALNENATSANKQQSRLNNIACNCQFGCPHGIVTLVEHSDTSKTVPLEHSFVNNLPENSQSSSSAALLLSFIESIKLTEIINQNVTDPRSSWKYPLYSIIETVILGRLFRHDSNNAFDDAYSLEAGQQGGESALAMAAGIDSGVLPSIQATSNVLNRLNIDEMNQVLLDLFEQIRVSKVFFNHPEILPGGYYHIAFDAVTYHKYTDDSDHDCQNCSYCLKRQRGETIWYCHMALVATLVCPGNIRLPLYVYPIHSEALNYEQTASDEKFKQECELTGFYVMAKKIRELLPKLKICALLDSLYANGPVMKLLKALHMEFIIVRKDGSIKTVREDCDGLEKILGFASTNMHREKGRNDHKKHTERTYTFFNDIEYNDMKLNILRFDEVICDKDGTETKVHWEWIVSWRLKKKNIALSAMRGLLRWLEEDLYNSFKNRGYNLKHDYTRNSNGQVINVIVTSISYFISELFCLQSNAIKKRGNSSIKTYMNSICDLILCVKFSECKQFFRSIAIACRNQIRYNFKLRRSVISPLKNEW